MIEYFRDTPVRVRVAASILLASAGVFVADLAVSEFKASREVPAPPTTALIDAETTLRDWPLHAPPELEAARTVVLAQKANRDKANEGAPRRLVEAIIGTSAALASRLLIVGSKPNQSPALETSKQNS